MFVREKRSVHGDRTYSYLQIVHSYRDGKKVRQKVIATLGRKEKLIASGAIDGLLKSLGQYSDKLQVVEAVRSKSLRARYVKTWGPSQVFRRLWEKQHVPEILSRLSRDRKFGFDVERVSFAAALQRLCEPGSDRQGASWIKTVEAEGFEDIELHHLYRNARFLHDVRGDLERELFLQDRDLFTYELDLVFIDTTSTYVYRDTETEYRRRGYSRDRRGDLPQFVLCVTVDRQGWPVAWEIYPGDTADKSAMTRIIKVLRKRFSIRRVIVVADRGMISAKTMDLLSEDRDAPFDFILGCKMRRQKEVRDDVLSRAGRYQKVEDNLEVKEVVIDDRRYVICRNPEQAEKDRFSREAILERLRDVVDHRGPKSVIGHKGYARFLKIKKNSVSIDQGAIKRDTRLDGKFVLRTNTDLSVEEVARAYKGLWRVERTFREEKSTLEIRPIYHQLDGTCIGHIVGCFLALRLEVDLQRRMDERKIHVPWPDLMRDLSLVQAVYVDHEGMRYRLRTDLAGEAYQAFAAAGVRVPSAITEVGAIDELP